jgi:hypothetical protein
VTLYVTPIAIEAAAGIPTPTPEWVGGCVELRLEGPERLVERGENRVHQSQPIHMPSVNQAHRQSLDPTGVWSSRLEQLKLRC